MPSPGICCATAIVRAAVTSDIRDSLVEIEINPHRANRVRLNRVPVPRPREVLGTLRCVLFAPEDLTLVKGDPDQRRRFLDDLLVATAPRYAGIRAEHLAVRTGVGVFDVSHMGQIQTYGPQALERLQLLTSNDVRRMPDGGAPTTVAVWASEPLPP